MSELKVINVDKMADVRSLSGQFYRKSEVDEVIEYFQNQLSLARTELIKSLAKAQHEAHYNKYHRCLDMAARCMSEEKRLDAIAPLFDNDKECWEYGSDYWNKWHKRWLEIAAKFKEAK